MTSLKKKSFLLRINLVAILGGGLFTIWALMQGFGGIENATSLGGLSPVLLATILAIGLFLAITIYIFYLSFRNDFWAIPLGRSIENLFAQRIAAYLLLFLLLGSYISLFTSDQTLGSLASYRTRLYPVLLWIAVFTVQLLLTTISLIGFDKSALKQNRSILVWTSILFGTFLVFVIFIVSTQIGIKPDKVLWQEAGVPLLFAQVLLAWIAGITVYYTGHSPQIRSRLSRIKLTSHHLDLFVCTALWALAFALWISSPMKPSYNSLEPRPPNFQSYPFGDSLIYDSNAQGFLIGIPIPNDFAQKPFYDFFLVILHLFAGQNYGLLVQLQVAVFSFIPVIVYLLTKMIGNRPAGMVAALLVVYRELNAISLSNVIQVSHSRLLMSDVFSMGLIAFLMLYSLRWLKSPSQQRILPLVIGGVLGFLILARAQTFLLLPFLLLAYAIVLLQSYQYRWLIEGSLVLILGLSIPLGIWVWRNYQWTGKLILQEPEYAYSYTSYMAQMYSMDPLNKPAHSPGEDDAAYYERIKNQPFTFTIQHPGEVLHFVSAHFMHNLIYSFVYLPQSLFIERPSDYVKRLPFWTNWDGHLPVEAKIFTVFNLLILALGTVVFWRQSGRLIFVPLLLWIGYDLSVSVGRLSGWRLILPVDWMTLIFYSIGLVQLAVILGTFFFRRAFSFNDDATSNEITAPIYRWKWGESAIVVLVLGMISLGLTTGHKLFSVRYPDNNRERLLQDYQNIIPEIRNAAPITIEELKQFLAQEDAVVLSGRGLYPSYMPANKGELNYYYLAFAPRSYKHLSFQLIGAEDTGIILSMKTRPESFPSGSDVLVFGCRAENEYFPDLPGYVDGLVVILKTDPPILYSRSPMPELTCPLPAP